MAEYRTNTDELKSAEREMDFILRRCRMLIAYVVIIALLAVFFSFFLGRMTGKPSPHYEIVEEPISLPRDDSSHSDRKSGSFFQGYSADSESSSEYSGSAFLLTEDTPSLIEEDEEQEQYQELLAQNTEIPLDNHFLMCDHGYEPLYSSDTADLYGNTHSNAFIFFIDSDTFKESYATFALNEEYTNFQFTYFPEKDWSLDDKYSSNRRLKIYGDDTLLFDTGGVSKMDKPQTVTIDVTGVEFLKVTAGYGAFLVGDGATGTMVLADGKLCKQIRDEDFELIEALY